MRRGVVYLAVVAALVVPTAALSADLALVPAAKPAVKKAAKQPAVYSTTPANQNELSKKVVVDAVRQIFVPLEVTLARLNSAN